MKYHPDIAPIPVIECKFSQNYIKCKPPKKPMKSQDLSEGEGIIARLQLLRGTDSRQREKFHVTKKAGKNLRVF